MSEHPVDPEAMKLSGGEIPTIGGWMSKMNTRLSEFFRNTAGATIVEYAVALIVVTIVGAVVLGLGGNVAGIIDASAGAF
ncbi:MAG: hypothetical protein AAF230_02775 [Pseudomonadota bacterium]